MSMNYNKKLIPLAKNLRKDMTRHEKHLWYDYLRKYPVRFQRQKTIDNYIVDFFCHKAKLVIELDGSQHFTESGIEYDQIRTATLEKYGLAVLRFSNQDLDYNYTYVCKTIDRIVQERCSLSQLR